MDDPHLALEPYDEWRIVMTHMAHSFASDNYAPVHPEILEAIARVNTGHMVAYGDDPITAQLKDAIKDHFGSSAEVFPVFNGTGANVVALQSLTRRWEAVIAAESAHVNVDEGGAPEKMAGLKLLTVPTPDGKLTPEIVQTQCFDFGFVHRAQQAAVTITQSTELGTLYSKSEISNLTAHAHSHGLKVHLDGARISNAAAALGAGFRDFTTDAGVDIVSFGGTKNGLMLGEAVVVLDPQAAPGVDFLRKTSMQLASKMRFVSAQLLALLTDDLWLRNASHSNSMAKRLEAGVRAIPGVAITRPVQANAVFAILPSAVTESLQQDYRFYVWNHLTGEVRWMCSWDTTEAAIDDFVAAISTRMSRT